ncbi:3'-5' exonuclease-like isoform X2 [Tasmannia lanceolata]|uniref:3'-5' exonuclease-like isoform X2 n=1 Tax=Tasmannia lanceolata TaxID=3420 RepID=UPI004064B64C
MRGRRENYSKQGKLFCLGESEPLGGSPKMRFPAMNFVGRIAYSRTFSEVEKSTKELLEIIESKKQDTERISLGLDIEWRPTFRKGATMRKAAVMQICAGNDCCYVMHIFHSGIPLILQSLLEDSTSVKVGVCIAGDATKVLKDYGVHIKGLEDLSRLANLKLGRTPRMWSLGSLTETLISKQLMKPNKIRLGNWETNVLSKEQLQYAATDAFTSWYLYQVLRSFPDAASNRDEEGAANKKDKEEKPNVVLP